MNVHILARPWRMCDKISRDDSTKTHLLKWQYCVGKRNCFCWDVSKTNRGLVHQSNDRTHVQEWRHLCFGHHKSHCANGLLSLESRKQQCYDTWRRIFNWKPLNQQQSTSSVMMTCVDDIQHVQDCWRYFRHSRGGLTFSSPMNVLFIEVHVRGMFISGPSRIPIITKSWNITPHMWWSGSLCPLNTW